MKKKINLNEIKVSSFTTNLSSKRLKALRGGLSNSPDCNFTNLEGCSDQQGCTDINQCDGASGCCEPGAY